MGDFGNAIKYLYSQFILRDVLSFITPGAIIVFTMLFLFYREIFDYSFHWLLYIPLFGVFYMVGFAVQCFGELTGLIRTHRLAESNFGQRLSVLLKRNWANDQRIWWIQAHRERVAYNEYVNEEEHRGERAWARSQDERMVVLKQICANNFLAVVIVGIFIPINQCCCASSWCLLILVVPLLAALFWGYCVHELRLDTIDRLIRHLRPRR